MMLETKKRLDDGHSVFELLSDDDSMSSSEFLRPKVFGNAKPPPIASLSIKRKDPTGRARISHKKSKSSRGSSIPFADRKPPPQYSVKKYSKPGLMNKRKKSIDVNTNCAVPSFKVPVADRKLPPQHSLKKDCAKNNKSLAINNNRFAVPVDERKPPPQYSVKENSKTGSTMKKPYTLGGRRAGLTKPKKEDPYPDFYQMMLRRQLQTKEQLQLKQKHVDEDIADFRLKVSVAKMKKDKNFMVAMGVLLKKRLQRQEQLELRSKHVEEEILSWKLEVAKRKIQDSLIDVKSASGSESDIL